MKKIILSVTLILACTFTHNTNAQIYMMGVAPLEPGNFWRYVDIGWLGGQSNFFVTDSNVLIGKNIYSIVEMYEDRDVIRNQHFMGLAEDGYFIKYFSYAEDSIYKYYKSDPKLNDAWVQSLPNFFTFYYSVIDTFTINAWGRSFFAREVKITDYSLVEVYQVWADSIGLMEENSIGQYHMILWGCVVNGVVYGDTTTVGIKEDFGFTKNYLLLQNYPNPFNPVTKISFYLPFGTDVSLKVYNLFGEDVGTLINEYRPAGHYSELFNGNGLSTGVYFYILNADRFTEMKKMILLK